LIKKKGDFIRLAETYFSSVDPVIYQNQPRMEEAKHYAAQEDRIEQALSSLCRCVGGKYVSRLEAGNIQRDKQRAGKKSSPDPEPFSLFVLYPTCID
jgi:hypothetical protein